MSIMSIVKVQNIAFRDGGRMDSSKALTGITYEVKYQGIGWFDFEIKRPPMIHFAYHFCRGISPQIWIFPCYNTAFPVSI